MEISMLYFIIYFSVTILVIILGAVFEKRVVGECQGDYIEHQEREFTYTMNVFFGSLMWPLSLLVLLVAAVLALAENIRESHKK